MPRVSIVLFFVIGCSGSSSQQSVVEPRTQNRECEPRGIPRAQLHPIRNQFGEVLRGIDGEFPAPNRFEQLDQPVDFVFAERGAVRRLEHLGRREELDECRARFDLRRGRFDKLAEVRRALDGIESIATGARRTRDPSGGRA